MLRINGKPFRCSCGANVFSKGNAQGLWVCNGCGTQYTDETYKPEKPVSLLDAVKSLNVTAPLPWHIEEDYLDGWMVDATGRKIFGGEDHEGMIRECDPVAKALVHLTKGLKRYLDEHEK